jgi:hypothetical protein
MTEKIEIINCKLLTAKERLEIIDKRADIKKKNVEIKKELHLIEMASQKQKQALEEQKLNLEKICEIRRLLSDLTVDTERTVFAGEPFLAQTIVGDRRETVMKKLMELINKIK